MWFMRAAVNCCCNEDCCTGLASCGPAPSATCRFFCSEAASNGLWWAENVSCSAGGLLSRLLGTRCARHCALSPASAGESRASWACLLCEACSGSRRICCRLLHTPARRGLVLAGVPFEPQVTHHHPRQHISRSNTCLCLRCRAHISETGRKHQHTRLCPTTSADKAAFTKRVGHNNNN